jgi:hypothetical protein
MICQEGCWKFKLREAAELGKYSRAECVIPCHYDMFTFKSDVKEFEKGSS